MTDKLNVTPGPWICQRQEEDDGSIYYAIHGKEYDFICNIEEKNGNAQIIVEAGNVYHETNLRPRQLLEQLKEVREQRDILYEALKAIARNRETGEVLPFDIDEMVEAISMPEEAAISRAEALQDKEGGESE